MTIIHPTRGAAPPGDAVTAPIPVVAPGDGASSASATLGVGAAGVDAAAAGAAASPPVAVLPRDPARRALLALARALERIALRRPDPDARLAAHRRAIARDAHVRAHRERALERWHALTPLR